LGERRQGDQGGSRRQCDARQESLRH
jgi:hypothetical protein